MTYIDEACATLEAENCVPRKASHGPKVLDMLHWIQAVMSGAGEQDHADMRWSARYYRENVHSTLKYIS